MLPDTMRTIEIREPGGPDVLEAGSRPLPVPQAHEVLVKVLAAGVNGPDLIQRRGHYPPPPGASDLLGLEISGKVVAVGQSVTGWKTGVPLCALTNGGGYAEYVAIDARHCLPIPTGVEPIDAAGLPETFFTVWSNCFHELSHKPGTLFLVHGGAGGIGSTAIQLGKALGLRVFATCHGEEDRRYCQALGAERAIDYRDEDFVSICRDAGGASLVLDIVGGDYIKRNIKAAASDARIVQLAFNQGSKVEIDLMPVMLKRLTYTGSTLRSRPGPFKAAIAHSVTSDVWPLFTQGKLHPHTHAVLPFDQVRQAHEMMEAGAHQGKILITP